MHEMKGMGRKYMRKKMPYGLEIILISLHPTIFMKMTAGENVFGHLVCYDISDGDCTTEAELISLCESSVEACWLLKLLKDVNVNFENVVIFEDNQSTIKCVKNPDQKRLKHMDIKYNFVKQKVEEGIVTVKYVSTKDQLADLLTKPLPKEQFHKFVCM